MSTKNLSNAKRNKEVKVITESTKGEKTMTTNANPNTTAQEVITVTLNKNTEKQGIEIRFSGYPKASIKNELVALKFRYYPSLGNAWIKKAEKVSSASIKGFVAKCEKLDYKVVGTKDGKPDTWLDKYIEVKAEKPAPKETAKAEPKAVTPEVPQTAVSNDAVISAMIALLTENGYLVTKAEKPAPEAPKAEAKTEAKPKTTRKPRAKKSETPKAETPKDDFPFEPVKAETPEKGAKADKHTLEVKSIPVSNNPKKTKAEKKLFVDGKEIARVF